FKQTRFIIAGFIGPWCNGNTTVFGAVIQGSSPCGPTNKTKQNKLILVHGVMVTLLFLVQSFKVRVLVDQQKAYYKTKKLVHGVMVTLLFLVQSFKILDIVDQQKIILMRMFFI